MMQQLLLKTGNADKLKLSPFGSSTACNGVLNFIYDLRKAIQSNETNYLWRLSID